MMRFTGSCEWIADIDVGDMVGWITAIPFVDWHQQHQIDYQLRPSMMTDLAWHGFGSRSDKIVADLSARFSWPQTRQRMLSVVMPGHDIRPHVDEQGPKWACRVHVPLTTNDQSKFIVGGVTHFMRVGAAYRVNTLAEHSVHNKGVTPRIHFMFDVIQ